MSDITRIITILINKISFEVGLKVIDECSKQKIFPTDYEKVSRMITKHIFEAVPEGDPLYPFRMVIVERLVKKMRLSADLFKKLTGVDMEELHKHMSASDCKGDDDVHSSNVP